MTSTYRARRTLVTAALVLATVTACTVSTNDEPLAVGTGFDELLTTTTSTTTTSAPPSATRRASVYFLQIIDGSVGLAPLVRSVPVGADITQVLGALFTQRPDPDLITEASLETAIPESAELLSAEMAPASAVLVVNVRGLFGDIQGNSLRNALAQIVWTATQVSDVSGVRFLNDGVSVPAIAGNGDTVIDPVDRSNYVLLN